MATRATSKAYGSETQNLAAEWYRLRGFPFVMSTGAGRIGRDLLNMIGLAPEVKGRADFSPMAWLRQAKANAGNDLPFVLFRPRGMGPASVGQWGVLLTNEDFTGLLLAAGYSDAKDWNIPLKGVRDDA